MFDSKQRWNNDKCKCNDKLCDVGEYLDYANCKCRKRLVNKLVEKCTEDIDEVKIAKITSVECNSVKDKNKCKSSCRIYIVLIAIVLQSPLELVLLLLTTST